MSKDTNFTLQVLANYCAAAAESMGWTGAIAIACAVCGLGGLIWLWINTNATKSMTTVS